ncbi:MAG: ferritin-like domain-containing protein, partial [Bacteroidota bacterium]
MRRSLSDFPETESKKRKRRQMAAIDQARPWQTQIYFIARQEMEHLGIATNLLASMGEPPYFKRPQFPVPMAYTLMDAPFLLERFNSMSLKTYIWFERPTSLTSSFPPDYLDRCKHDPDPLGKQIMASTPSTKQLHDAFEKFGISSVEELYDQIQAAFQNTDIPAAELFKGDTEQQVGDVFGYKVYMKTITNRVEAAAAIDLIIEQGEGTGLDPLDSEAHFQRFTNMYAEYEASLKSAPKSALPIALPCLTNPRTFLEPEDPQQETNPCYDVPPSLVRRQSTLNMMTLFNDCYNLMMLMLYDFFDTYQSPDAPATAERGSQAAKFYGAFFPLMTMVIRPLGEILCRIPAGAPYPNQNAGAAFEIDNALL